MADRKRYRRCRNCGALLQPKDGFCPQCGIGTEQSYESREPVRSEAEYRRMSSGRKGDGPPDNRSGNRRTQNDRPISNGQKDHGSINNGLKSSLPRNNGTKDNGSKRNVQDRYRQENLEGNWSEDWGRPVDENRMTAMQYVLIVLLVILLAALLALGGFWLFGRSSGKSSGQRASRQEAALQTEQDHTEGNIVTILDPNTGEPAEMSGAQTEAPGGQSGTEGGTGTPTEGTGQEGGTGTSAEGTGQEGVTGAGSENAGQQPENAAQTNTQDSQSAAAWSQPESSERPLTDSDLEGLTYDELQMAINEIYARHGRIFKTPEIGNYFESQPWYEGTLDADHFDESVFSAVEAENIQFILKKMGDG